MKTQRQSSNGLWTKRTWVTWNAVNGSSWHHIFVKFRRCLEGCCSWTSCRFNLSSPTFPNWLKTTGVGAPESNNMLEPCLIDKLMERCLSSFEDSHPCHIACWSQKGHNLLLRFFDSCKLLSLECSPSQSKLCSWHQLGLFADSSGPSLSCIFAT